MKIDCLSTKFETLPNILISFAIRFVCWGVFFVLSQQNCCCGWIS